jgi:hypothetical protein
MKRLLLALAMVVMVSPAWGADGTIGATIKSYDEEIKFRQSLDYIFQTVGRGMLTATVFVEERGDEGLYCPPMALTITGGQYFEIFKRQAISYNALEDPFMLEDAAVLLLRGLVNTFPCT